MPPELRTGAVLAGFRVESLLGEGAMGTVYLAEETSSGRRVALKLLAPELARDERFRRRFLRETELAASLDHPRVVATLASGEEEGTLYLAMAYVEGSDLRKLHLTPRAERVSGSKRWTRPPSRAHRPRRRPRLARSGVFYTSRP